MSWITNWATPKPERTKDMPPTGNGSAGSGAGSGTQSAAAEESDMF